MEDYREIGPPGNGETRKTGASNLAAVRETTRHVRIHASRVIFRGALQLKTIQINTNTLIVKGESEYRQILVRNAGQTAPNSNLSGGPLNGGRLGAACSEAVGRSEILKREHAYHSREFAKSSLS